MNIYFDTEFWEHEESIELISLGAVREDGAEFYCEFSNFDWNNVPSEHWIQYNVRPHLLTDEQFEELAERADCAGGKLSDEDFRQRFLEFVGESPQFWTWYGDYDWVALCQKYGSMIDLPAGWPQHALDLRQEVQRFNEQNRATGQRIHPRSPGHLGFTAHNALEDAKWTRLIGQEILQRTGWNGHTSRTD